MEKSFIIQRIQRVSEIRTTPIRTIRGNILSYFPDAISLYGGLVGYSKRHKTLLIPVAIRLKQFKEIIDGVQAEGGEFAENYKFTNFVSRVESVPYFCTIPRRGIQAIECFSDTETYTLDGNVIGYSPSKETLLVLKSDSVKQTITSLKGRDLLYQFFDYDRLVEFEFSTKLLVNEM